MKDWKKGLLSGLPSDKGMLYLFLLAAALMEFALITVEGLLYGFGYYAAETYLVVPALLFLGAALTRPLSKEAKLSLLLSAAMVLWFALVQLKHRAVWGESRAVELFLCVYLLAFPFAAVAEDGGKDLGMKMMAVVFTAASLMLVGYSALLVLDCVPESMAGNIYWDGTRLHPLWHPNIAACVFMIGIAFCLGFFFQTPKAGGKAVFAALTGVQFLAMALTNCRTSILMTCALIGGTVFFAVNRGGWKRFVLGLAAALVLMAGLFLGSGRLYDLHTRNQIEKLTAQQEILAEETVPAETAPGETVPVETGAVETIPAETDVQTQPTEEKTTQVLTQNQATGEVVIAGDSMQGTLTSDLRTLNGRTGIWKGAVTAMQDDPSLRIWGTPYVGLLLSAYNSFPVEHAHNSWMEILMQLGIPGLILALVFTLLALVSGAVLLWRRDTAMWKKTAAMLELCLLVAGFLEPYLFISSKFHHFIDFLFFFCLGYLTQWCWQLRKR